MQLQLDRHDRRPLYLQLVEQIQDLIRSGALPSGSRLPPIRQLANELGLTRLTVHNAYAELQADGWIESFVGRGSFVAEQPRVASKTLSALASDPVPTLQSGSLSEVMRLAHQPGIISFAQAAAAPETFPMRDFGRVTQQVLLDAGATLFDYGVTQGELELRKQIARYLLDRGMRVAPADVVIVSGAQQGIDLVLRSLLKANDAMLVEQPTYLGMVERMQLQGVKLVGVPIDEHGMRLDAFETAIALHQPRLLYTIPTFHNPTGISMSAERKAAVLEIAQRHNLLILEDDIYGLLCYNDSSPLPLKAHDTAGLVIYLSSFSKVLMPGLRLGMLAAAPHWVERLIAAKRLADLHSPQLLQHALAEYLARGHFAAHLRKVKELYAQRRDAMATSLQRHFPAEVSWIKPEGGLCFWIKLPAPLRSGDLYLKAIERGVAFTPGRAFFPQQSTQSYMRLSFAAHAPDIIERGIATLGEVLHEQLARRSQLHIRSLSESVPLV
jgi:2-aminoadipate transaminase